jgi:excisionase family DNA binding protein
LPRESLVSIREASHTLGVNEATLRQWTDEGKIKAFITPGGHRRYSKAELRRFLFSSRKVLGVRDLVGDLEDTVQMHRELDRTYLTNTSWYNRLRPESRGQLAELGRRLLHLIIKSIAEPSKREENLKGVREIGCNFGETLAQLGFPLTDSVEAFIKHRDPITEVIVHLMKKREGFNRRIVDAIPLVNHAMDEALVSLVTAHQQETSRDKPGGSTG